MGVILLIALVAAVFFAVVSTISGSHSTNLASTWASIKDSVEKNYEDFFALIG